MSFTTDKQTLDDLNIFGKRGAASVYSIFNHTHTNGGAGVLDEMFRYPLSDEYAINERSGIIQYFKELHKDFPFRSVLFDSAEQYLDNTDNRSILTQEQDTLERKFSNLIGSDTEYKLIYKGISSVREIIQSLNSFLESIAGSCIHTPYLKAVDEMKTIISDANIKMIYQGKRSEKLGFKDVAKLDKIIRNDGLVLIKKLLAHIYNLDVFISVAKVAEEKGFVFPKAINNGGDCIKLDDVYHPLVPNAVPNSVSITAENNIMFLTGANMAGKSTFMKTLGVAFFLAHMGFPVAARKMEFSVMDGIFTTINLPDNINLGYSHFYAEVLRVKKIAALVGESMRLLIIFDELFRGTNVKDAGEATVAITSALAHRPNCFFVVSTHIMEAGEELKNLHPNINFVYMPTLMEDGRPVYPYKLESGVTSDRYGMVIINNEGIIDIIRSRTK